MAPSPPTMTYRSPETAPCLCKSGIFTKVASPNSNLALEYPHVYFCFPTKNNFVCQIGFLASLLDDKVANPIKKNKQKQRTYHQPQIQSLPPPARWPWHPGRGSMAARAPMGAAGGFLKSAEKPPKDTGHHELWMSTSTYGKKSHFLPLNYPKYCIYIYLYIYIYISQVLNRSNSSSMVG